MRPSVSRCTLLFALSLHAASAWTCRAMADEPSPEARVRAQQRFSEGEVAYRRGDYRGAAEAFDAAYREIHHHVPLFNAARAWARAGENARAANAYDRFLDEAPPEDPDRPTATSALKELSAQLGQLHIAGEGFERLKVDDAPVDRPRLFVAPGLHEIEGRRGDRSVRRSEKVGAGEDVHVRLELPRAEAPKTASKVQPEPDRASSTPAGSPPAPFSRGGGGWSPIVVAVGGGLTLLGGVLTIASGADTIAFKHGTFASNENPDTLGEGVYRQRRTNILLGTTIGLFALTGAAALFLVDWRGNGTVLVGAGPDSTWAVFSRKPPKPESSLTQVGAALPSECYAFRASPRVACGERLGVAKSGRDFSCVTLSDLITQNAREAVTESAQKTRSRSDDGEARRPSAEARVAPTRRELDSGLDGLSTERPSKSSLEGAF